MTRLRAATLLSGALPLFACGTDVERLLQHDSVLVTKADRIAAAAEAIDPDLTADMYDAEESKRAACWPIYASVADHMARTPSYGEELASDIGAFVAYLVPIEEIERCAEAQFRYQARVEALERRLGAADAGSSGSSGSGKRSGVQ